MSNIFLAYKFTGEDPKDLAYILGNIQTTLVKKGHTVTCSFFLEDFFQKNNYSSDYIYNYMLKKQENCDLFMALLKTEDKSKGMLLESQKAIDLNQRYVVASKSGVYIPEFHDKTEEIITYKNYPELFNLLKEFE